MPSDEAAGLRISVWRRFEPTRQIAFHDGSARPVSYVGGEQPDSIQQEVYIWQIREDVWGGIEDAGIRDALRDGLLAQFAPFDPPVDRSIEKFGVYVAELQRHIRAGASKWSISSQDIDPDHSATPINLLLAFFHQLEWIFQVFKNMPGVSVTVR